MTDTNTGEQHYETDAWRRAARELARDILYRARDTHAEHGGIVDAHRTTILVQAAAMTLFDIMGPDPQELGRGLNIFAVQVADILAIYCLKEDADGFTSEPVQ